MYKMIAYSNINQLDEIQDKFQVSSSPFLI